MILPTTRIQTYTGKQGTGFAIARNDNGTFVLTNHHVVEDCIQQNDRWDPVEKSSSKIERLRPVDVEVFKYDDRGRHIQTVTTSAEIVAYTQYGDEWDFEGDIALLKLKADVGGLPCACLISEDDYLDNVRTLDDVIMVGCPGGAKTPLATKGHFASIELQRAGMGLLLSHVFGNPGSSGSPVYRFSEERGAYEVIAIHSLADFTGKLTDDGRGTFLRQAVTAPDIHSFLKSHGFEDLVPVNEVLSADATDEDGEPRSGIPANGSAVSDNLSDPLATSSVDAASDGGEEDLGNATAKGSSAG